MVARDLARFIETATDIRRSRRPSYRILMGLCINEAFQNRVINDSRTIPLAFNHFLDLLRTQKITIGPANDACRFVPTYDPIFDYASQCSGLSPYLYLWGKELTKICRDSGFWKVNHLELDSRDKKVESVDEEPNSNTRNQ
ncbi:hypothetical protein MMC14_006963 [Varicellaria rhodocarpa]|nr:hypothetical protein [Varicellaria rhodocarpa]